MIEIALLIPSVLVLFYVILLIRSLEYMSISELKRQAHSRNVYAARVYSVRAYGIQLSIFIWTFVGLLTSCIVLLLDHLLGLAWTVSISVLAIVFMHAILPWTQRFKKPNLRIASAIAPFIERILRLISPVSRQLERLIGRWVKPESVLVLHSKNELVEILHHNAEGSDLVSRQELQIAENALLFGEKLVGDYMTPLAAVQFIGVEDELTPVVLGELHDGGHSRLPVYSGDKQTIVGTLFLKDALQVKSTKVVKDVMRPEVYYINERQELDVALRAFIKTKHHLFIVVNEFEDVVGAITLEDIIEQIIGKTINDEFDKYDDMREVARIVARQKHAAHRSGHVKPMT